MEHLRQQVRPEVLIAVAEALNGKAQKFDLAADTAAAIADRQMCGKAQPLQRTEAAILPL